MTLIELIAELKKHNPETVVKHGFAHPHSYRGDYAQVAFEPADNIAIGKMLAAAEEANGETYEGYKGGYYEMGDWTDVYLASYGNCGEQIGAMLLSYMLADVVPNDRISHERSEPLGAAHGSDSKKGQA